MRSKEALSTKIFLTGSGKHGQCCYLANVSFVSFSCLMLSFGVIIKI